MSKYQDATRSNSRQAHAGVIQDIHQKEEDSEKWVENDNFIQAIAIPYMTPIHEVCGPLGIPIDGLATPQETGSTNNRNTVLFCE